MFTFIAIYVALSHPDCAVRESASAEMMHLVDRHPEFGPWLALFAGSDPDPERVFRARVPLNCYFRWKATNYVPKGIPCWPICDATFIPMMNGPCRCKAIGMEWFDYAAKCPEAMQGGPWWWKYRAATERKARQMIYDGADPAVVDELMRTMWQVECSVQSDCASRWAESANWREWRNNGYPTPQGQP